MSGFELGHVSQLHEIQNRRRRMGLPDHFLEKQLEKLILEFKDGDRTEDVTWLQAKKYWILASEMPLRLGKETYKNFAAYLGSIPQLSEAMRKEAGMLIPVLVDPRFSLGQLVGEDAVLLPGKYSAETFLRRHRGGSGDPYWMLVQVVELQKKTSLSAWTKSRLGLSMPPLNAFEGACLHLQSPYHLRQQLLFPGDLANRSTRIAAMRRTAAGRAELYAADAQNLDRGDLIAVGVTKAGLDSNR